MGFLNVLLYPFAALYRIATGIRNHLYEIGHKKSFRFECPVISVGNLSVGGSGKTPTIEYLIRLLVDRYKIATLSRGYGRKTRGLRFATDDDAATTLGDEPYQFYKNFGESLRVVVAEERAYAIPNILHQHPDTNVILLDDAFQHRSVKPQLNILLTNYIKPFYKDFLLPMGRLRERRREAKRADIIIVTKCPKALDLESEKEIRDRIIRYSGPKSIFFSSIVYGNPTPFHNTKEHISHKVVLVTGIAKSKPLEDYVTDRYELIKHFKYRDHHAFKAKDLAVIAAFIEKQNDSVSLLTTEKDMVRLLDSKFEAALFPIPCFYLPIEMHFLENGAEFDAQVINVIEKTIAKSNSLNE